MWTSLEEAHKDRYLLLTGYQGFRSSWDEDGDESDGYQFTIDEGRDDFGVYILNADGKALRLGTVDNLCLAMMTCHAWFCLNMDTKSDDEQERFTELSKACAEHLDCEDSPKADSMIIGNIDSRHDQYQIYWRNEAFHVERRQSLSGVRPLASSQYLEALVAGLSPVVCVWSSELYEEALKKLPQAVEDAARQLWLEEMGYSDGNWPW